MKDRFGRDITYLRLSVTDLCNLRCVYCMPEKGVTKLHHDDILTIEEIEEIVRAASLIGIKKVRITGGEPLVRRGVIEICRRISSTPGIAEVCLTTNGTLLPEFAGELLAAGVHRVNISIDSLDPERYRTITRGGELTDALRGVEAAREAGFGKIKINVVLMHGINSAELRDFTEMSRMKGTHVRFIEIMPIGSGADWARDEFLSCDAVLKAVPELEPRGIDGVAKLYALPNAEGTVGLVGALSARFCNSCNRLRITSDGKMKPCLHSSEEIPLRGLHGEALIEAMYTAILNKPKQHTIKSMSISESSRDMNAIGG